MTGLQFDGQDVLYDGMIGVASEEYTTNWGSLVSPVTRTEKKEVWFDPKHCEEKGGKEKDKSSTTIKIPATTACSKTGYNEFPTPVPSRLVPTPPVQNMQEGVKKKGKEKKPEIEEVEMESEDKAPMKKIQTKSKPKAKSTPSFHYTSNIKDAVKSEQVYDSLKDTKITISIGDLLGLAPELQKRFVDNLKTH
ncbi:hypothetical protein H0H87_006193 [Tephrocybe sp. NHM501043]|nr:hypothetical protein H0H87_006749 [Tephrocybe sp. NHM501043]KAG6843286.1 hypothetical protein H0H87_006193 [Tephrocybe sp. NHM501043]